MDAKTLNTVNAVLQKEAGYRLSVNPLADKLAQKLANDTHTVQQTRASEGASTPSSASSKGMENKNSGYGKSTDILEDDPKKDGAAKTGDPQVAVSGASFTHESEGMKDLTIPHHTEKAAALNKLRKSSNKGSSSRLAQILRNGLSR